MSNHTNYYFDDLGVYAHSTPALPEAVAPPDNALWIAPHESCPTGYAIVVRDDRTGWDIIPDYRATGAYDQKGQWQRIDRPGELPEGWTANQPEPEFTPGPDYEKYEDGQWYKVRYSKKDFLLLCGFDKVMALNAAIKAGNIMAQSIHDLLFAAEFIDITDTNTMGMVNMLTSTDAGSILTLDDARRVLSGELYEGEKDENTAS